MKPSLKKNKTYFSYEDIKDKSLLDILDSLEEHTTNKEEHKKDKCKCCNKVILNHKLQDHQIYCFQNKIKELSSTIEILKSEIVITRDNTKDIVTHGLRIKIFEFLIDRNNEKWNKIYNK